MADTDRFPMRSMAYELAITPEAEADLQRLIDSLPPEGRSRALPAIIDALKPLGVNPALASRSSLALDRPMFLFRFEIDAVGYHWAATFAFGEDERTIVITHLFRPAM